MQLEWRIRRLPDLELEAIFGQMTDYFAPVYSRAMANTTLAHSYTCVAHYSDRHCAIDAPSFAALLGTNVHRHHVTCSPSLVLCLVSLVDIFQDTPPHEPMYHPSLTRSFAPTTRPRPTLPIVSCFSVNADCHSPSDIDSRAEPPQSTLYIVPRANRRDACRARCSRRSQSPPPSPKTDGHFAWRSFILPS